MQQNSESQISPPLTAGGPVPPSSPPRRSYEPFFPANPPQACDFCGVPGLTVLCEESECERRVHCWCVDETGAQARCSTHEGGKKGEGRALARSWRQSVCSDFNSLLSFQAHDGSLHVASLFTGTVLWYLLCSQYFPGLSLQKSPFAFSNLGGGVSLRDLLQWIKREDWDLQGELNGTQEALIRVQKDVDSLLVELEQARQARYCELYSSLAQKTLKVAEDDWILKEVKLVEVKRANQEYLRHFEKHQRVVLPEKRAVATKRGEKRNGEEDLPCAVCGDGDYEDDNLILFCDLCNLGVHLHCYGLSSVPSSSWLCQACQLFGPSALPCALCPLKGGILKQTTNLNNGQTPVSHITPFDPLQPESVSNLRALWCHIFCAVRVPKVSIEDRDRVEGISLEMVDGRRFRMMCEVCGTRDGACIKCGQKRCGAAFHPECGKMFFLYTGGKNQSSLYNEIFCAQHSTFKLRKLIEAKERSQISEISSFFREFEKFKSKRSVREWTTEEIWLLEKKVTEVMRAEYAGPKGPFVLTVEKKRGEVQVEMPLIYNLMDPQVLLDHSLRIPTRTREECFKFYSSSLYPRLQKFLEASHTPVRLLPSTHPAPSKSHHKAVPRISEKGDSHAPVKKRKTEQPAIPIVELAPVVTEELFCVCRKPYVEKLPQRAGESEEEYREKLRNNSMMQCGKCGEWFHLGCIGFQGSPEEAEKQETWCCPVCCPQS